MNTLGSISSVTTGQLQQARTADADRAVHEARTQSREASSARTAEAAEGVGEMTQDESSTDRDADGRRLWERPAPKKLSPEITESGTEPPRSVDPEGQSGGTLDLVG